MTAEQFLDAVWMITGTAPARPTRRPARRRGGRAGHRFVRAALVNADLLMRSLGRPNREQVVTTRERRADHPCRPSTSRTARSSPTPWPRRAQPARWRSRRLRPRLIETIYLRALGRQPTADERRGPRAPRHAADAGGPGRPALGGVHAPRVPADPLRMGKERHEDIVIPGRTRPGAAAISSAA